MVFEVKTVKKTLPPRLFFVGGSWVEALVGVLVGSRCGFCLNLHVNCHGIGRFSLCEEARNLGC
jgi:hypothetical protein